MRIGSLHWGTVIGTGCALVAGTHPCSLSHAAEGSPAPSPPASSTGPALAQAHAAGVVVLALYGDELPRDALRDGMSAELAREVVLQTDRGNRPVAGVISINYRRATDELVVTWDSKGRTLSRVIAASRNVAEVMQDSLLLAGNLAREQADELAPETVPRPVEVPPAVSLPPPPSPPAPPAGPQYPRVFASASFFFPLATHASQPEVTSSFDFNVLYSRVGAVEGAGLGLVNVVTRERPDAARMNGLQIGGIANLVTGNVTGIQVASSLNLASGETRGVQLAAGANIASGPLEGLQTSFVFNRAGDVRGGQISLVNLAGNVHGAQIGLVNIARHVRGVSIGLVNVADEIEGIPLAPISVTRSGGMHPVLWGGTSGLGNAGIKFATRQTYTLFFGSYHQAFDEKFVGGGLAVGGRIHLGARFHADLDAAGTYLIAPGLSEDAETREQYHEQLVQPRLRLLLGFRAAKHFGIFVGGAALGQIRAELDWDRVSASIGPEIQGGIEL